MSPWEGRDGNFSVEGLPQIYSKTDAELKALADGDTEILIAVEIQEGKEQMAAKEFTRELGPGTALTLRLCKHYFGSGRTVIGDSAFSFLKTLMELRKTNLFHMGIVKTATKGYPLKYMQDWYQRGRQSTPRVERGESNIVLKSS